MVDFGLFRTVATIYTTEKIRKSRNGLNQHFPLRTTHSEAFFAFFQYLFIVRFCPTALGAAVNRGPYVFGSVPVLFAK